MNQTRYDTYLKVHYQDFKESLSQGIQNIIVNDYSLTLLRSGYNVSSVRQIIISGLRGFKNKVRRAAEAGRKLHRSAESSLDARLKKKIFAKTSWFKNNKKAGANKKYTKKVKKNKMKNSLALKVKSVIFVPRTPSSKLCKLLRAEEQRLAVTTGYRVKIQERNGIQLRRILCKRPIPPIFCGRDSCMICKPGGAGDCRRRNILYINTCDNCKASNAAAGVESTAANTALQPTGERAFALVQKDLKSICRTAGTRRRRATCGGTSNRPTLRRMSASP